MPEGEAARSLTGEILHDAWFATKKVAELGFVAVGSWVILEEAPHLIKEGKAHFRHWRENRRHGSVPTSAHDEDTTLNHWGGDTET
jgi:hypothetical protein